MARPPYANVIRQAITENGGELEREKLFFLTMPNVSPSSAYRAAENQRIWYLKKRIKKGLPVQDAELKRKRGSFDEVVKAGRRHRIRHATRNLVKRKKLISEIRDGKIYYRLPENSNGKKNLKELDESSAQSNSA